MIVFLLDDTLSNILRCKYLHVISLHYYHVCSYKLVHDGALTWRFSRGKMVELHVVLLEDVLVLLTKVGDGQKLLLKIQVSSLSISINVLITRCISS